MKKFMQTHQVYLTPLSPVHIGCGEDFEPTNYVIEGETLFNFEPSHLMLNDRERTDLLNAVNRLDLLAIQRFFLNHKDKAIANSGYFVDVSEGLAQDYKNRVGKVSQRENDGNKVINNLSIERTAFLPLQNLPYIPGSGFKGALATVLLDQAHQAKNNPKVNVKDHGKLLKEYIGDFTESKLRNVKFSDFIPKMLVESKIYYALNFKKKLGKTDGKGRAMALRRECITAGQYRSFQSELTLTESQNTFSLIQLIDALKKFYLPVFKKEMELLQSRNLVSSQYVKSLEKLITLPKVSLIRLGKNGADSKTYQGENIAQIKIMGAKGTPPMFKDSSTTVWLAGTSSVQQTDLLPFGWALIEVDPTGENETLKTWCEAQPKSKFDRSEILAKREAQKAEQARLQAEAETKRLAEQQAESEKQALLNSLSNNQRLVMDFVEKVQSTLERQADNTGSTLLKEAQALIESAVENWDISECQFVKAQITIELLKSKIDFRKKDTEKTVKKWLNKLEIE
ncbi:Hypothetical protein GGA_0555 [Haemophilus haemolyticus M21127]|uniref:RAMP superfamily CRISPR-associated protein n=1 Tax=Haemophilus haemolyticus TaxID=726 RepID=UPI00021B419D|nr:RAMP superfamily CRISPR-associated protein [Haemophilus haemolyticus]EGT76791.1 Hypothetical protein GGA_0555 [Haemophilus haemolyticus M21127]